LQILELYAKKAALPWLIGQRSLQDGRGGLQKNLPNN
jgi:hypothetical protein